MNHQKETQLLYAYFIQRPSSGERDEHPIAIHAEHNAAKNSAIVRALILAQDDPEIANSMLVGFSTEDVEEATCLKEVIDNYFQELGA